MSGAWVGDPRGWVLVVAVALVDCVGISNEFACASDDQCRHDGAAGVCETTHYCSFPDNACAPSQRRYGELAGGLSGTCVVTGVTYFVSPSGDDGNPGTQQRPFRTIGRGVNALTPGDTLYVESGTYAERISGIPAGRSWAYPVRIASYPDKAATLHAPTDMERVFDIDPPSRYVIVEGFVIQGPPSVYEPLKITTDHVRVQGCEISGSNVGAVYVRSDDYTGYNELIDLYIHDNGVTQANVGDGPTGGIEISSRNNLIRDCLIRDNSGAGIQLYADDPHGADGNVVRGNVVLRHSGVLPPGIRLGSGSGILAFNNVVADAAYAIRVVDGSDIRIVNNTLTGWTDTGLSLGGSISGLVVQNDIFFGTGLNGVGFPADGVDASHYVTSDPSFVAPDQNDFHVKPGSVAIDTGVAEPDVPDDRDGVSRPQGNGYDIGAYER